MTRSSASFQTINLAWLLVLILSCAIGLRGQSSACIKNDPLLKAISEELKDKWGNVRFHREEDIEDRFIVHGLDPIDFRSLPLFFRVQQPRFDLSRDPIQENVATGLPTMYLATSNDGTKIYRLYGFQNPEEEFSRLLRDNRATQIRGTSDAEMRGLLCAEIVYGLSSKWWLTGEPAAKLEASQYFFDAGHRDGLQSAEKWWKSLNEDRELLKISTARNADLYVVNLPIFSGPVEGDVKPEIRLYRIEVNQIGACHMNPQRVQVLK